MRKVSVAILSWNGVEHLKTCLAALGEQTNPGLPWEILVLDNGSRDGTSEWVSRHHPEVRLISSRTNLGFCAGNNRLVQEAEGDAIAFLNNDARPEPGWLTALVGALAGAPEDVAAVSGTILDWSGDRLDFAEGVMTFDGHAFQRGYHRPLGEVELPQAGAELLFPCGGNMMIRRRSFLEAGGFDEDYFAYLEDVDLGWRLWSRGERVRFVADAVVRHRSMATSDLLGLYNRGFLFERNAFLTVYKNYESGLWQQVMPAVLLTLMSRTQTLLVQNNPGAGSLRLDPYAGAVANTAVGPEGVGGRSVQRAAVRQLGEKWRSYGLREFVRRGFSKAGETLRWERPRRRAPGVPRITDERTVAQFRSQAYLLGHLDAAAEKRQAVQAARTRGDREIFERFPVYLVPTYPGDEKLFASPGFLRWLPPDLPLVRRRLDEVMEIE